MRTIHSGWWQVAVALIIQAISAASIFTVYSVVAAPLKAEFQPSHMVLMLGLTITSLVSGLLSPPLGTAVDRFSVRKLMMLGSVLLSSGFFLLSLAASMTQVVIIYGIFMSTAVVLLGPIACSALLSRWFTHKRGLAMGLASSGGAVGGLILPPLLQALIGQVDWRIALQIFSVLIFVATFPLIFFIVRDYPRQAADNTAADSTQPATAASATSASSIAKLPALTTKQILSDPTFWLISLMLGTIFCGPMGLVSNMLPFASTKGIDATQGALLLSVMSGAGFASKLIWSSVIDNLNLRVALAIILSVLGLSILGAVYANSFIFLLVAIIACGISSGGAVPIWSLVLARVYGPPRLGQVMGIMTFVIIPFTLFSPPIFGRVFDVTGSYNNALLGYLGLIIFALLWLTRLQLVSSAAAEPTEAEAA